MHKNDWVVDVLLDLQEYAKAHDMKHFSKSLSATIQAARFDSAFEEATSPSGKTVIIPKGSNVQN